MKILTNFARFDDGSVVLRAKDPHVLFRVHRALIARHSEVFRNMFLIPQPPPDDHTAMIEGCPVVELHDSAKDVASLLRALYDGPYVTYLGAVMSISNLCDLNRTWGDNGLEDFETVSGVLRLSHKYLIDPLRTKAIEHLQKAWPSTLEGWDAREDLARWYDGELGPLGGRYPQAVVSQVSYQLLVKSDSNPLHSVSLSWRVP